MTALRCLRYIALLIPAVAGPLRAQDRLLVPGNPPLTETAVAIAAQFYEWALDVRLSEAQYHEFERLLVDRWKQPGGAARAEILKTKDWWGEIVGMRVSARGEIQPRVQDSILARLRASARGDDAARWLLARYAEAHQALAPGNPPLTKVLADRMADYWEWVLDVRLGDRERRELQQFQVAQWAQREAAWKRNWIDDHPGVVDHHGQPRPGGAHAPPGAGANQRPGGDPPGPRRAIQPVAPRHLSNGSSPRRGDEPDPGDRRRAAHPGHGDTVL